MAEDDDIKVGAVALAEKKRNHYKLTRAQRNANKLIDQAKSIEPGERKCTGKVKLRDPQGEYLRAADGSVLTRPCKAAPIRGGFVCPKHGGSAPQVKLKAQRRLDAMVEPAIVRLDALVHQEVDLKVSLGAIKVVLERAGGSPVGALTKDTGSEKDTRPIINIGIAVGGIAPQKVEVAMLPPASEGELAGDDDPDE